MTSEGFGEMFEGDSADTLTGKFPLVSMGGRAEGLACAEMGARNPPACAEISYVLYYGSLFLAEPISTQ